MSRTRSYTRGVHVSKLGAPDAFPSGLPPQLEAAPRYLVNFTADAGVVADQDVGMLPAGAFVYGTINHVPLTGGTVAVSLIDPKGVAADLDLVASMALNADATASTGAFFTPIDSPRIVRVTIAAGTGGETAVMGLDIGVSVPAWR